MKQFDIHLKSIYAILGKNEADPVLSLFIPYNMKEMNRESMRRPTILLCPGGGYEFCSEREAEIIALKLVSQGYNVAILYYSVKTFRYPTQLIEVAASMDAMRKNASAWNIDTDKIGIMGFSAGGHLAAQFSTRWNSEEVKKYFPDSIPPKLSILCYPVITAVPEFTHKGSVEHLIGHSCLSQEEIEVLSCERNVNEKTPPAFIWSTSTDELVPVVNSLLYAEALDRNNIPFELHIYPHGRHGLSTADFDTNDELDEKDLHVREWMPSLNKWLNLEFSQ